MRPVSSLANWVLKHRVADERASRRANHPFGLSAPPDQKLRRAFVIDLQDFIRLPTGNGE